MKHNNFKISNYQDEHGNAHNNLKAIIKNQGYTLSQVAAKIGVSQQQVSKYISGANLIDIEKLALLCRVLDCKPEDIYQQLKVTPNVKPAPKEVVNNIYVKETSSLQTLGNWLSGITTVDFFTLNKNLIIGLLFIMSILVVISKIWFLYAISHLDTISQRIPLLLLYLNFTIVVIIGIVGLILPLMVQNIFAYVPLVIGVEAIPQFLKNLFKLQILNSSYYSIPFALVVVFIYYLIIKKAKSNKLSK